MLRKVWTIWKAFGEIIGNLVARIILSIFYITVFVPFAVITRLSSDRLGIETIPENYWLPRNQQPETLQKARGQS